MFFYNYLHFSYMTKLANVLVRFLNLLRTLSVFENYV